MPVNIQRLKAFLALRLFFPLAILSGLACLVLAGQMVATHSTEDHFLAWNLFLAWVPYLCSLAAAGIDRVRPTRWRTLLVLSAVWLIFLPNAPYLVTDFVHLHELATHSRFFNATLLSLFAINGCALGVVSLYLMHRIVHRRLGAVPARALLFFVAALCGVGVYVGRFLRWNSWHVITEPGHIFQSVAGALADPLKHERAIAVTMLFMLLTLGLYAILEVVIRRRQLRLGEETN